MTPPALWFASGGLSMMFAGVFNLLNDTYGAGAPGLRRVCVAVNVVMTLFATVAGVVTGATIAELIVVLGVIGGTTVLSVRFAFQPRRAREVSGALLHYLALELRLHEWRTRHPEDTPEEDALLDDMDVAWSKLTASERSWLDRR